MPKFSTCRSPWIQIRPLSSSTNGSSLGGHVGVEQAGRAAVEGVRVGGHRAVLRPERDRVGLHQRREGVVEDRDDQVGALLGSGHGATMPDPRRRDRPRSQRRRPQADVVHLERGERRRTCGSRARQAPAGSGLIRASTCSGWLASARIANRSTSALGSTNRWPAVALRDERDPRRQVEERHDEDRHHRDRQAQLAAPARSTASMPRPLAAAGRRRRRRPRRGLGRGVADQRDVAEESPVSLQAGRTVRSRRPGFRSAARRAPGSSRAPTAGPDPEHHPQHERAGRRRSGGYGGPGCRRTSSCGSSDQPGRAKSSTRTGELRQDLADAPSAPGPGAVFNETWPCG